MDTALSVAFIAFGLGCLATWAGMKLQDYVNSKHDEEWK